MSADIDVSQNNKAEQEGDIQEPSDVNQFQDSAVRSVNGSDHEIQRIHQSVLLLRDQVDAIQVESRQRGKPWYKNPSLIISAFALLISILFSSIGLWQTTSEDVESKQELLTQTIVKLTDVQSELTQNAQYEFDPLTNRAVNSNLNMRRMVLIDTAMALVKELGDNAVASTIFSLASQVQMDGRFGEALELYQKSLELSDSQVARSSTLRGLGSLYLLAGNPLYDLKTGRDYLRDSTELYASQDDDGSKFNLVDNLLFWAIIEASYGEQQMADSLFEQANDVAEMINIMNPNRQLLLMQIEQAKSNQILATQQVDDLSGEWKLEFENNLPKEGRVIVIYNPPSRSYSATIMIFETGELIETRSGGIVMPKSNKFIFQWQGFRYSEQYQTPLPSSGISIFDKLHNSTQWTGADSVVGCVPEDVNMVKVSP